jgi:hypothetical protein
MDLNPACEDCLRLLRDCSVATNEHIRLDAKRQIAALEYDLEKAAILKEQTMVAEEARQRAKETLRQHQAEAHARPPITGEIGSSSQERGD